MGNVSLNVLASQRPVAKTADSYTQYTVNGHPHLVPIWSHPGMIANHVLNVIQHTKYFGIQVIAPPGNGKTTIAKVIAHHIHKKDEMFDIRLEKETDTHAFEFLDDYIKTLPKRPTIVIFDDLSGVFGRMREEDIDKNFETLTTVRWVLDPAAGQIPFIPILTYHYSKVVEKKFRSQNGMTIMCSFGNEEKTNIDTIAPKGTLGRKAVLNFEKIYQTMFPHHKFSVYDSHGYEWKYDTDKPFRAACMIAGNIGTIILTAKDDICTKCDVSSKRKRVPESQIVQEIREAYGLQGIQALRQSVADRGFREAINPSAFNARRFIEDKIYAKYSIDFAKLVEAIYKDMRTTKPKRVNRKRKIESEILKKMDNIAIYEDPPISADIVNPGETKMNEESQNA